MPERGIRSTYSQCPLQILMGDDDGILSTGTAFFYDFNGESFLITNWHNVSGRHFRTKEMISYNGRHPTYIKAKFASRVAPDGSFTTVAQRVAIYENDHPIWFEHPDGNTLCDLIALPLQRPAHCPEFMHNAANRISSTRIPVTPGCTVFILGFPSAISVGIGLPVWKAGYVASEPYYNVTIEGEVSEFGGLKGGASLRAFFIDSQTRAGMSGARVFASYVGDPWDTSDPYRTVDPNESEFWSKEEIVLFGRGIQFVGCYSGRIGSREDQAALGLCWREDAISKICASKVRGQHPHLV